MCEKLAKFPSGSNAVKTDEPRLHPCSKRAQGNVYIIYRCSSLGSLEMYLERRAKIGEAESIAFKNASYSELAVRGIQTPLAILFEARKNWREIQNCTPPSLSPLSLRWANYPLRNKAAHHASCEQQTFDLLCHQLVDPFLSTLKGLLSSHLFLANCVARGATPNYSLPTKFSPGRKLL